MEAVQRAAGASIDQASRKGADQDFDTGTVVTVASAHLVNDAYVVFLAAVLPLLIPRLGIPLALAGALATIQRLSAVLQPLFGFWADRIDARYFLVGGPAVTAVALSSFGLAPNYLILAISLAVGGLSTCIFHPAAAASVTRLSGKTWGKGMSIHMFGGETGRAIGPLFIVSVISWLGLEMSYLAALPGLLCSAVLWMRLSKKGPLRSTGGGESMSGVWRSLRERKGAMLALSGLVLFRSTASMSISTFYPTFLTSRGDDVMFAGLGLSVYLFAGAAGALVGGTLSDRFGRRRTMLISMAIGGPLAYVSLIMPNGLAAIAVMGISGALSMSATPVQLTLAQELVPGSRGTVAGIMFLLGFEGTIVSTLVVGIVADWIGLGPALEFSVLASMLSIPFTIALPEPRSERKAPRA